MNLEKMNLEELTTVEVREIEGGGKWRWDEAAICMIIGGPIGVGFYYLGTTQ